MPGEEAPKLIIDTDWKSQAQAEKERLSQAAKPGAGGGLAGAPAAPKAAAGSVPSTGPGGAWLRMRASRASLARFRSRTC